MAESVDALVSNTSGATHPGSIPGLGTETEKAEKLSPFFHSQEHWRTESDDITTGETLHFLQRGFKF